MGITPHRVINMWAFLFTLAAAVTLVLGHGRVLDPPGRGTAWRSGYNSRANYDDDGLNCGGFHHQHSVNGGKCGLCGDAYDESTPRAHERGGIYDAHIIVGSYEQGSIITITVEITAHHLGYWEFKLCTDGNEPDQECFDENLLELEEGGTKYYPNRGSTKYFVNYRLPQGVSCDLCVLQWRYTCGNNWGRCSNGTEGLGCGNQETFGACSDISIVGNPDLPEYVPVDSLLLQNVDEEELIRLLLKTVMLPPRLNQTNPSQKQRLNSKKPRTNGFNFIDSHIPLRRKPKPEKNRNRNKQRRKNKRKKTASHIVNWMASWR